MAVPVNIDTTFGFLFHSIVICSLLYGVALMQGWSYFTRYKGKDGLGIQLMVATVLLCDTCQVSFLWAAVYKYTLTSQADPLVMTKIVPELIIELIFSGFVAFVVQHFYCYRIFTLSKNIFLAGFISLCSLGSIATLYYFIGVVLSQYTLLSELALQNNISIATNVLGLVTDAGISIIMIALLQRSKTGFRRSTDLLNRLILFSVNTGERKLQTKISSSGMNTKSISSQCRPSNKSDFDLDGHPVYTNCLLITLNGREYMRNGSEPPSTGDFMSIPLEISGRRTNPSNVDNISGHDHGHGAKDGPIAIRINQQTTQNFDDAKAGASEDHGHYRQHSHPYGKV
ncbi:hypothetical protein D9758_009764 [Tetrapyrgos nigripes]|uniref:DUF6534 domain-containing protein n=1 Tax=Tetrapyrgos nigripes TaxID=182062 RepID=A0A8H5GKI6_9AGAR|nr:hypothetical protein D9758_009764 [Tetrapyrgos nigripes]